ncbi:hypothetical protein GBF38_002014 [Nibea albiflora]|uniref:Uncharacterized protein n=1 Tax=Nibea albiflora TaxID=240163 RepID=A0ACB7EDJ7_NIBAL|nr:hypothetical protein GBF38_002014 [Nibea albiflora]
MSFCACAEPCRAQGREFDSSTDSVLRPLSNRTRTMSLSAAFYGKGQRVVTTPNVMEKTARRFGRALDAQSRFMSSLRTISNRWPNGLRWGP